MKIERFIVSGGDNYNYLIIDEEENKAIAVDPLEVERLEALAKSYGVYISHILLTHGHGDHTGGAVLLSEKTQAKILGHKDIEVVTQTVNDGEVVRCNTIEARCIVTPGHTYDSVCYLIGKALFTGDTVFFSGAGNCYSGDADSLYDSFSQKVQPLADTLKLYPGHEYAVRNLAFALSIEPDNTAAKARLEKVKNEAMPLSTLGEEKTYNPFFRFNNDDYREALEIKTGGIITDPKEAFLITRELRNQW